MDIKNLLLHLDHSDGCRNRLDAAFALARNHDARITGMFVVLDYVVPTYVEAQISVDLMTAATEQAVARANDRLSEILSIAATAGVDMEGHVVEGQLIPVLRDHGKYADLLILGQYQPDDPENMSYGLADTLLLEGACPCLVVPNSADVSEIGSRVLLAWNASREASHALHSALPLLSRAERVVVLASEPNYTDSLTALGKTHAAELQRFLSSHHVESTPSGIYSAKMTPSEAIIAQSVEMNANLIVMGAYGHTRLREVILGGVTHDLLKNATLPLFLAH